MISIKEFYGKDILVTYADGDERFLLWKDYSIERYCMGDDGFEIELMHKEFLKFRIISKTSAYSYVVDEDVTLEILN